MRACRLMLKATLIVQRQSWGRADDDRVDRAGGCAGSTSLKARRNGDEEHPRNCGHRCRCDHSDCSRSKVFRSRRDFAAWIGLQCHAKTERWQAESSGRSRNGAIAIATHSGGRSLRGVALRAPAAAKYPWLTKLLARKAFKVVAVALANKMARIAWALRSQGRHLSGACLAVSGGKWSGE